MAQKMKKKPGASKTSHRGMDDTQTKEPKAIAGILRKGIRVGLGRKPEKYIYSQEELAHYDPEKYIILKY